MKTSFRLIVVIWFVVGRATFSPAADDVVIADFESGTYQDWKVTGDAFGHEPAPGTLPNQQEVSAYQGKRLINSFQKGDATTGEMTSPQFAINRPFLAFRIGGGMKDGELGIALIVDGKTVRQATGENSEALRWESWDVTEFSGKTAHLSLFDRSKSGWGHVLIDDIRLTDSRRFGYDQSALENYRQSPNYLREPHRPGFHFTPEINWTNDPNGLVYFDGEYHLFYQFNPFQNVWGHMSWGHAVSRDLVHWQHLPVAFYEQRGIMAFSGSAVVDRNNSSGFGQPGQTPLVAIYTGHAPDAGPRQTQEIAWSVDRGRTWKKFAGNPVIDRQLADFRDPKVFWHAPTQKWIMVVSLAVEKRLLLYGSKDLIHWDELSSFGPAGHTSKPNWECPDLFPLNIEGESGRQKWVMHVSFGNNSIAGGSGSEYFIGEFDGTRFTPDPDDRPVRWVDYGRDFYAPISYSDIPESDGRRIWIGWMNNWETANVPTSPWRGAMSIPRSLSLRKSFDGLRMVQAPVAELESLRTEHHTAKPFTLKPDQPHAIRNAGARLEIRLEVSLEKASEFGIQLRKGPAEQTVLGYDSSKRELFIDRTKSGNVSFDRRFPGRHTAPLPLESGRLRLHIFVDSCSIEVFAENGTVVMTELIFPDANSTDMALYSSGADVQVHQFDYWELASVWHDPKPSQQ